jgi:enoyl-[acyl-carrier protein] reductase II
MLNLNWMQFTGMGFKMMASDEDHPMWVLARQAAGMMRHTKALYNGDTKEGIFFAGQIIGACNEVPTVADLIDRVIAEAEVTIKKTNSMLA